jgi:hypothetical protein
MTASVHPFATLPTAAPQQSGNASSNTITLQRALSDQATPERLRAVADWNERRSYDERRRKARTRHKAQAAALRATANELEASNGTELHREAA